jgi:hypothetical protein
MHPCPPTAPHPADYNSPAKELICKYGLALINFNTSEIDPRFQELGRAGGCPIFPITSAVEVWTGVTAVSPTISVPSIPSNRVATDRFGQFVRICFKVTWNRALNLT